MKQRELGELREITGYIVSADGGQERVVIVAGSFGAQLAGLQDDFVQGFVSAAGVFPEDLDQVLVGRRVDLNKSPDDDEDDEDESPEVISVHGGR